MSSKLTPNMIQGLRSYKFYPQWLAPNVLTFTGFLMTICHYLLLSFYNPYFNTEDNVPRWVWLAAAVLSFLAHTLDGTDGKQARRTKSSSALGELLDHGCDSWTCLFLPGSMFTLFREYSPWRIFLGQWILFFIFISSHWEKYITGTLFMPWAHDISEIGCSLLFLLVFYFSPAIFNVPLVYNWSITSITNVILIGNYISCTMTLLYFVLFIFPLPNEMLVWKFAISNIICYLLRHGGDLGTAFERLQHTI